MRSTGHAWPYKAWCSAVISCFFDSSLYDQSTHRLKKTSSMQSKRRDLHHTWLHRETNEKLSFYCYSPRWITTTFSTKFNSMRDNRAYVSVSPAVKSQSFPSPKGSHMNYNYEMKSFSYQINLIWLLKSKQNQAKCKFSIATCKSSWYNLSSYNIFGWGSLIVLNLSHE